jgi:hypothetical protein
MTSGRTWRIRSYISPSGCGPWTLGTNRGSVLASGRSLLEVLDRIVYWIGDFLVELHIHLPAQASDHPASIHSTSSIESHPDIRRHFVSASLCPLLMSDPCFSPKPAELSTNVCVRSIMGSIQSSKVVLEDREGVLARRWPDLVDVSINRVVFELSLGGDRDLVGGWIRSSSSLSCHSDRSLDPRHVCICSGTSQIWRDMFAFDYRFGGFLLEFP